MNERIKELMEEAGIYDFVVESMGINEEMEKFAQMIVLKCADIADTAEPFLSSDLIKEYFGVKE